jgi:hypothetical protein
MNLPLLVWAWQQGGDATLRNVVCAHVNKTLAHHFRPEGSVYVYKFDPETGEPPGTFRSTRRANGSHGIFSSIRRMMAFPLGLQRGGAGRT